MRITFYQRVLLLLSALLLLVQLANLSVVLTTVGDDVRQQLRDQLSSGVQLVSQLAKRRSELLITSAEVLAADFGFRSAIASRDPITITSALKNNLNRIDAELATFFSLDGTQYGVSNTIDQDAATYEKLFKKIDSDANVIADTLVLNGNAKQIVAVPIKAPLPIGWLVLGFSLDDKVAKTFSDQVGMHVTFTHEKSNYPSFGSTLPRSQESALPTAMSTLQKSDHGQISTLHELKFLTEIVELGNHTDPVLVLLHSSLDEAMASYYEVRKRLLSYMAIGLILVMALGFWFARGVTRPVKSLAEAALRIRNGDYETSIENSKDAKRGDEFGELIKLFGEMQSGIAQREATILHQALFDDLTGLPNRRQAQDRLEQHLLECSPKTGSVILLGLDRNQQIVETLGHAVGESVVKSVCERLTTCAVDAKLIARVSSDEFLLLIPTTDNDAIAYAQTLIPSLTQVVQFELAELIPELTAGIVIIPEDADNAADTMRRASIALADARDKNLVARRYENGREENYIRRLSIVADLKSAVEHDQLILHFQPKINMKTGATTSVEALVRWIHPTHGFLPPDEFIGLAEQSGNIGMLTQWVLNSVISQLRQWQDMGITLKSAVNLSALDLQDESLFSRIEALLMKHNIPASQLIIEVTESAMLRDTHQALNTLRRMQERGLTISIDDFGTGYSSLAKLKDLPIDELKIDRAFVTDIEPDTAKAKIIKAIIDLGHSIGLTVISEGVETQEEWDLLATLGNDVVQGYLISRPLPPAELTQWWINRYPDQVKTAA